MPAWEGSPPAEGAGRRGRNQADAILLRRLTLLSPVSSPSSVARCGRGRHSQPVSCPASAGHSGTPQDPADTSLQAQASLHAQAAKTTSPKASTWL